MKKKLLVSLATATVLCATAATLFACGETKTYKVTYSGGDGATGTAPAVQSYKKGEEITLAGADTFTKEGHTFNGWNDGEKKYEAGAKYTMGAKDVAFTADWSVISYTVSFELFGEVIDTASVEYGTAIGTALSGVELPAGITVSDWYAGNTKVTEAYVPTGDVTLIARAGQMPITVGSDALDLGFTGAENPVWKGVSLSIGQKLTLTGIVKALGDNAWQTVIMNLASGEAFGTGFRMDNWAIKSENGWVATMVDGKTVLDNDATYLRLMKAGCNVTLDFDWSDTTKIVCAMTIANADNAEETVTVEGQVVPANGKSGWQVDRVNLGLGGEKVYLQLTDYALTGDVHTHQYDADTKYCSCGKIGPHDHDYQNYVCSVCGEWQNEIELSVKIGDDTHKINAKKDNTVVVLDTNGAWDHEGAHGSSDMNVTGDFAAMFSWTMSRDNNWGGQDAWVEIQSGEDYFDLNPPLDIFGSLATKEGVVITDSGTAGFPALGGSENLWEGSYTAVIARVGSTLNIVFEFTNTAGTKYTRTVTATGFTTADLSLRLAGNAFWIDNLNAWSGALNA